MNRQRLLIVGSIMLLIGIVGITIFPSRAIYPMGMMNGMMMNGEDMKDMMKSMMGRQLPLGIDASQLPDVSSQGALLMRRYCTQCHDLPGPGLHTAEEWLVVFKRMLNRMQMMSDRGMMSMMHDIDVPSKTDSQTLLNYLQKHAQQAMDQSQYADLHTPAGKLFQATCAQCHVLPDPKQHTAKEWPDVVNRMTNNMRAMSFPVPDRQSLDSIIDYLELHAQQE